jgi:hypothetical protein
MKMIEIRNRRKAYKQKNHPDKLAFIRMIIEVYKSAIYSAAGAASAVAGAASSVAGAAPSSAAFSAAAAAAAS